MENGGQEGVNPRSPEPVGDSRNPLGKPIPAMSASGRTVESATKLRSSLKC